MQNHAIGNHGLGQGALGRASAKVPVANANRNGARRQSITPQVGCRPRDQPEQLAFDVAIVVEILAEGFITAQPSRRLALMHSDIVDPVHAVPEPARLAVAQPLPQRVLIESENIFDRDETAGRKPRLKLWSHERNVGQGARSQECFLGARIDDVNAATVRTWLRPVDGEFGDELVRATTD